MRYLPPAELGDRTNVVVDGAANPTTKLVLSHWPHSGTAKELRADTSAEIVLGYLGRGLHRGLDLEVVTNDHFDEDGVLGVWAMTAPEGALRHVELIADAARAGDFGTYRRRDAARLAFALSVLADPDISPLDARTFEGPYPTMCANLYRQILPRVPELLGNVDAARELWSKEDELLTASEARMDAGEITIEERAEIDLAIVHIPERLHGARVHRFTKARSAVLHPMAVHNRTERMRVLLVQGHHYELQLRYETWVQYASRRLLPRPDLHPLARELSQLDDAAWTFDGVERITPRLSRDGASQLDAERIIELVAAHLARAPAAWDPYDP